MKEYILPEHTALGGWYIPEQLCDDLIECFKAHPWRWVEGKVGPAQIDTTTKESTDMYLPIRNTFPAFLKYMDALGNCIGAYQIKYSELKFTCAHEKNVISINKKHTAISLFFR